MRPWINRRVITTTAFVLAGAFAYINLDYSIAYSLGGKMVDRHEERLRGPEAFSDIPDNAERSEALFREMGKVIESPRCMNCHPKADSPTQREGRPHTPPVTRGVGGMGAEGLQCSTCHGEENVTFTNGEGSIPGHPAWHLAPATMAWQGSSLKGICEQLRDPERNGDRSLDELVEHNSEDTLVGWAWTPGVGREPAPGTQELFGALTRAWVDSGAVCPGTAG
ncbi:Isoquinoline 1-oxidoreductase subunit [Roseibium limicola]|nr:Isoquinoline 1-oxidoreductase subunit [Roseibium limicola]